MVGVAQACLPHSSPTTLIGTSYTCLFADDVNLVSIDSYTQDTFFNMLDYVANAYNWWNNVAKEKAKLVKGPNPLRIGILGAADINYTAIIDPTQSHTDAVIAGIAARQITRAEAQIKKHNLGPTCKAYGAYADLLADPNIQAVYIPLPNGLHAEWAIKALDADKHVLIEKPIASNAAEARAIRAAAERNPARVVLEAFHWRFHPAAHRAKQLIDGGQYGAPVAATTTFHIPPGAIGPNDIRFQYALGGGACMDLTYVFSACAFLVGGADVAADFPAAQIAVTSAQPRVHARDPLVDVAMRAEFTVSPGGGRPPVQCTTDAALSSAKPVAAGLLSVPEVSKLGMKAVVELERAQLVFSNFATPHMGHSITVTEKNAAGELTGKTNKEKCYEGGPLWKERGQPWWSTYRYQLEAFVDAVRAKEAGKEYDGPWMTLGESEKLMEVIDGVYAKAGLPRRGTEVLK